ncbi:MAG: DJ-1/PfpI family protein [Pseudomonadota bacterium]
MTVFAILAYDGIEPIDIGATYGVLSMAKRIAPQLEFYVVSERGGEVVMANGLRLMADRSFSDHQASDVLMVLGGPGWSVECDNQAMLSYLRELKSEGTTIASVCTGALILEAAGLLSGLKATTKVEVFDGETPPLEILGAKNGDANAPVARVVDAGQVLTGGGVSLGIDMTLYLLQRFCGAGVAEETARVFEYSAAWQANADRLPDIALP